MPDFGMLAFSMDEDFDINAAFQEAIVGVASDTELALEEKVRRMQVIVDEGTSQAYRDFVDFRAMAAQMEMMCDHDHALGQSVRNSDTLSSFMDGHKAGHGLHGKHNHKADDEYEVDSKTGKKTKKKKKRGWFGVYG